MLHYIPLITSYSSIHICRIFLLSEINYNFCYVCVDFQHLVTPLLDIFFDWYLFTENFVVKIKGISYSFW